VCELAGPSWAADGVIDDRVNTDVADPTPFRFVEEYEDEAAFGAHVEMGQSRPETEQRLFKSPGAACAGCTATCRLYRTPTYRWLE